jgi:hypothetical protein
MAPDLEKAPEGGGRDGQRLAAGDRVDQYRGGEKRARRREVHDADPVGCHGDIRSLMRRLSGKFLPPEHNQGKSF